jgi:hypothetical protein
MRAAILKNGPAGTKRSAMLSQSWRDNLIVAADGYLEGASTLAHRFDSVVTRIRLHAASLEPFEAVVSAHICNLGAAFLAY